MRIGHITLAVADIPRSRAFYLTLGCELIVEAAHYCRFAIGETTLSVKKRDGAVAPAADIGIEFDSAAALDAEIARLRGVGVPIVEGPVDRSWLWRDALIRDPDGHDLLYYFAGENKLNPPWRVKS